MTVNGNDFVIWRWGESALVGIIDGLGHGPHAHVAASAARQYVERHYDQPLKMLFQGISRACSGTRGVVMALGRFDWAQSKLTFGSVGNTEARVLSTKEPFSLPITRGILGIGLPAPEIEECPWDPSYTLVLHTDGVSHQWQWEDLRSMEGKTAAEIAFQLLQRMARDDDDATVIVVRESKP